jgi:hypothetical protein
MNPTREKGVHQNSQFMGEWDKDQHAKKKLKI